MKISNTAAIHITDYFIETGIINTKDQASYIYCFEYAIDTILFPLTLLVFGIIFNRFIPSFLFCIIIIPLKMMVGGAHASTRIRCSIISYTLFIVTLFNYKLLNIFPLTFLAICYIMCCTIVVLLSPVDHKNNRLSYAIKSKLKKLCFSFLCFISILYALFIYNEMPQYYLMINACLLIVPTNQIIGKLTNFR